MSVTRGFFLSLATLLFTACLIVIGAYFIFGQTVLNVDNAKQWVRESKLSERLGDEVVIPQLNSRLQRAYPSQTLISDEIIQTAAQASFSADFYRSSTDSVITSVYKWLNSEQPSITYSISIKEQLEQFYASLTNQLNTKIAALPYCSGYAADESNLLDAECVPRAIEKTEAASLIVNRLKSNVNTQDTLTEEQLPISFATSSNTKHLPDYVSYLWLANLVALPFALLFLIILIWSGRWFGTMLVGISLLVVAIIGFVGASLTNNTGSLLSSSFGENRIIGTVIEQASNSIRSILQLDAIILLVVGIVFIGLGILWRSLKNKRKSTTKMMKIESKVDSKTPKL